MSKLNAEQILEVMEKAMGNLRRSSPDAYHLIKDAYIAPPKPQDEESLPKNHALTEAMGLFKAELIQLIDELPNSSPSQRALRDWCEGAEALDLERLLQSG